MSDPYNLQRFLDAQKGTYETALEELRAGSKQSHWMWFVFPQLRALGRSPTAQYYGIGSLAEARAYLDNAVLSERLRQATDAVLIWSRRRSAQEIFGAVDALKLRSSLTLFDRVEPRSIFERGLQGFYSGAPDEQTLALLNAEA